MDEITREQIVKLAHEMVAAGNLNTLYGIEPFMKAQANFEEALTRFAAARPAGDTTPAQSVQIETERCKIPDFLRYKQPS